MAALLTLFPQLGPVSYTDVDETVPGDHPLRLTYEVRN